MFRPYNLTSIAAWTFGSLAGNKAYYAAKANNRSGPKFSRVSGNPAYIEKMYRKLANIGEQVVSLHEELESAYNEPYVINTTPFLKYFVYSNWLNSNKNRIKDEFRVALERAMGAGYVYQPNFIQKTHSEAEELVKAVDLSRQNMMQYFDGMLAPEPTKDKILERFNEIMSSMRVDEGSWKLIYNGDGLRLRGLVPNSETVVPEAPKKRAPFEKKKSQPRFNRAKVKAVVVPKKTDFHKKLYIARGEETLGPYKYSLLLTWLENGNASKDDLVAYDGAAEWVKLGAFIKKVNQTA
jgi:hypothetical protein